MHKRTARILLPILVIIGFVIATACADAASTNPENLNQSQKNANGTLNAVALFQSQTETAIAQKNAKATQKAIQATSDSIKSTQAESTSQLLSLAAQQTSRADFNTQVALATISDLTQVAIDAEYSRSTAEAGILGIAQTSTSVAMLTQSKISQSRSVFGFIFVSIFSLILLFGFGWALYHFIPILALRTGVVQREGDGPLLLSHRGQVVDTTKAYAPVISLAGKSPTLGAQAAEPHQARTTFTAQVKSVLRGSNSTSIPDIIDALGTAGTKPAYRIDPPPELPPGVVDALDVEWREE